MSGNRAPKYRKQRRKGGDLAFVELNGAKHYLGHFGSNESRGRHRRLLAEWAAGGGHLPVEPEKITIYELRARFLQYAQSCYKKRDGTTESENFRPILKALKELYGPCPVIEFGAEGGQAELR